MNILLKYYFGEGPGIPKDAPKATGLRLLAQTLRREWWELIKLNLLFVAFSLPIVTLPAAYFATVSVCAAMIEDRNVYLLRDFWNAFRARFWPATAIGAAVLAAGALAVLALRTYFGLATTNVLFVAPLTLVAATFIGTLLFSAHLFVGLAARTPHTLREIARASALGVLSRPLPGLGALAFVAMLWLAHILFYPASVLLPVLVNFSLGALVVSFAVMRGVQPGLSHGPSRDDHPREPETQSA